MIDLDEDKTRTNLEKMEVRGKEKKHLEILEKGYFVMIH
jgi:hypothetical protein